ncbi:hypothetical protein C8Q74DRAFT_1310193 [Fomes fomentarius]|nr:hypothetical protein C8Q74DRAFT_1310193 [Fomes fomentarius]
MSVVTMGVCAGVRSRMSRWQKFIALVGLVTISTCSASEATCIRQQPLELLLYEYPSLRALEPLGSCPFYGLLATSVLMPYPTRLRTLQDTGRPVP